MLCGLLGEKLGHSYSPQIHSYLANYSYDLFEKAPEELESFLRSNSFHGLNVTIPYKKSVIPYLDALSDRAKQLGSVNTIVRRPDGRLIGHNTDFFGFRSMVLHSGLQVSGKKVLVLGSGGASVTAVAVLQELGAEVVVISRNGKNNYSNLELHANAAVIVNATPVGMYPETGRSPVDLDLFPCLEGVLDLIYNPARTQLLLDAEQRGLISKNGLWMLVAQAKESAEWFTGQKIPNEFIDLIYKTMQLKMKNIILIGMPGCGKSTLGRLLADKLGREFVDADQMVTTIAKMPIPTILQQFGEEGFRQWETRALMDLGKRSGLVIATGGGCVTRPENYPLLHQNGAIVWLKRAIPLLPINGRPLSQAMSLERMYQIREPLYRAFADITIKNDSTLDYSLQQLMDIFSLEDPS